MKEILLDYGLEVRPSNQTWLTPSDNVDSVEPCEFSTTDT